MSTSTDRIDADTHSRIFAEKIIPESKLLEVAPHERPKAIILGGQPGAGKGGLADTAERELGGDVVKVDPDELRKYHPDVETLRSEHPYTWSSHTHPDAAGWADELRQAAIDGRKHFIFDTTLSNGEWTVELIKDLQAKGYDVEVRVVVAHKLESELGVDQRFAEGLDDRGYGRYVPAAARDAIYDKVPASLDTIHAHTNAPIRIFSREGQKRYDNRTSALISMDYLNNHHRFA